MTSLADERGPGQMSGLRTVLSSLGMHFGLLTGEFGSGFGIRCWRPIDEDMGPASGSSAQRRWTPHFVALPAHRSSGSDRAVPPVLGSSSRTDLSKT